MRSKGYGRIVNVTSSALAGVSWLAAYAASKGGLFSLTRSLAAEGAAFGIKANAINPGAFTRMVAAQQEETSPIYRHALESLPARLVSPVVALLSHESCPVTGECIEAVGGGARRIVLAQTPGFFDPELSLETLAQRWSEVMAGVPQSVVEPGTLDATRWHVKPYRPARGD
jgi:hypothetical protein